MPSPNNLGLRLAIKAFELIGGSEFSVSASLSIAHPDSLKNFEKFQEILLMAFAEGKSSVLAGTSEDTIALPPAPFNPDYIPQAKGFSEEIAAQMDAEGLYTSNTREQCAAIHRDRLAERMRTLQTPTLS